MPDRSAAPPTLTSRISTEVVRTLKQYWGKGPVEVKSYFVDDLLLVVMKGGMTTAEETMLEFGESDAVRQYRQLFQNRMADKLIGLIEEITGREVATYQSQVLFEPSRVVELFFFDDAGPEQGRRETAEALLRGGAAAKVAAPDLEPPATPGQQADDAAEAARRAGTGERNI